MTLLALLLALAQQPANAVNNSQDRTVGQTEPAANAEPKKSTSSNTSDKAESLSTEHNTELQGGTAAKSTKSAKQSKKSSKSKKAQGRSAKALPEPAQPPSSENKTGDAERESGKGKGRQQPKPLGEKSNQ
jgi:hypothetical protein